MREISRNITLQGFGKITEDSGFVEIDKCSDTYYERNKDGVTNLLSTGDKKVELIGFENRTLAYVKSSLGYPAYYPVLSVEREKPVRAVVMDLDGTTVKSEEFWIWIIQKTVRSLLDSHTFELEDRDLPFVSGHSVSEHLKYCINKYIPEKSIEEAKEYYFLHTHHEMQEIMVGRGRSGAFKPNEGIRDFLLYLKGEKIRIGLVTSGLYEKAYPEILSAFQSINLGDPKSFYDCIITAGYPLRKGSVGTLGELEAKPHPWLYNEVCCVGLGIPREERNTVIGIEDSGAGVCSVRLAGYYTVGIAGGNIEVSGNRGMCHSMCQSFKEIQELITEGR